MFFFFPYLNPTSYLNVNLRENWSEYTLHKKWSFPLRISIVNATKSGVSCGLGHIYGKKVLNRKLHFLFFHFYVSRHAQCFKRFGLNLLKLKLFEDKTLVRISFLQHIHHENRPISITFNARRKQHISKTPKVTIFTKYFFPYLDPTSYLNLNLRQDSLVDTLHKK